VTYFTSFSTAIKGIDLPKKFTFPFYYEPHRLAEIASAELQAYLRTENELNHSFGIDTDNHEIGKMFGVLVVQNLDNELGYLSAFSGNIEGQSNFKKFVPPIYDILAKESFFQKDNKELVALSEEINLIENEDNYLQLKESVFKNNQLANKIILDVKRELAKRKQLRNQFKKNSILLSKEEHDVLKKESAHDKFYFKELVCYYENKFINQQEELNAIEVKLRNLKALRVKKSNALHQKIFDQYHFLNIDKKEKDLNSIFAALNTPAPAGTGDCAAPKLLQYAFLNNLKPIAMAEFWWGKSGNSAIRKHKNFYPSCKGKCEPILSHMLEGMELDENPLLLSLAKDKKIEILFEDDSMLVINKPTELLSVPGKNVSDSVFNRLKEKYPKSTDYLIVHRLDMSTSGIMLIAKTKKAHKFLQAQFINRTIKKKYIALLDGIIQENEGEINLPLRVDLDDRPKQLVCIEHGRPSNTLWKVLERKDNKTRIEFTPTTGRTHQLRVHAAHKLGLNTAIVGDDLYGKKANRLHLHAAYIKFVHPLSKKVMEFLLQPQF
jgi:tRNA pseudouridine32 synthase/23S rRNA pseudouridine746 synthase